MKTGIDNIRKVVAIIGGTLAIILMVFTLCKKVGLCAEISDFPLPMGESQTYGMTQEQKAVIDQLDLQSLMDMTNTIRQQSRIGYNTACLLDWTSANDFIIGFYNTEWSYINSNTQTITNTTKITIGTGANEITAGIRYNNGQWDYWYSNNWSQQINIGAHTTQNAGKYVLNDTELISGYPIYTNATEVRTTDTDLKIFVKKGSSPEHSKGGVLAEITENDEIAEAELPQIDTEAPTDTSSNPAWYQKILNAIGKVGLNIQSNTITTGNYLEQILTGQRNFFTDFLAVLGTHIGDITDRLDTIIGYDRENQASTLKDDWIAGYNNSEIKAITVTGQNLKNTLSNIGNTNTGNLVFGPWRLTYISGNLHLIGNYTMPEIFGGGTHQQDISFEWYENIRSWVVNIFKVFLFVGFAWYLVTQVPNMIHGTSGVFEKGRKEK